MKKHSWIRYSLVALISVVLGIFATIFLAAQPDYEYTRNISSANQSLASALKELDELTKKKERLRLSIDEEHTLASFQTAYKKLEIAAHVTAADAFEISSLEAAIGRQMFQIFFLLLAIMGTIATVFGINLVNSADKIAGKAASKKASKVKAQLEKEISATASTTTDISIARSFLALAHTVWLLR